MKQFIPILIFAFFSIQLSAQAEEEDAIRATLQDYIEGSSYNDPGRIEKAFYPEAYLFLSKKDQEIYLLSVVEYSSLFEKREKGTFNGRVGNILSIDRENNIATAKAEILIGAEDLRFIDLFLLKKLEGEWKIISKAATLMPGDGQ